MKRSGLTTIKVSVTRKSGRLKVHFTGSDDEIKKAEKIVAGWS
jgi:hypothetical protein